MASDGLNDIPPDTNINDFDYLAMSLEAEILTNAAYGYVSVDSLKFYLGQMRRVYQTALAGQNVVRLVFVERDGRADQS
jgi:hypothetical protein